MIIIIYFYILIMLESMKRIVSFFNLMILVFWVFQVYPIYASYNFNLRIEQQKNIRNLNKINLNINKFVKEYSLKNIDKKVNNRLKGKEEEINILLKEVETKIKNKKTKKEIETIVSEAKKRISLKLVSWTTKYGNINDTINNNFLLKNRGKALNSLKKSIRKWKDYSFIIKTKFKKEEILNDYKIYDKSLEVNYLYSDWDKNYYEIIISNNSIFRNEIFENIDQDLIPEKFLWIDVVKPEIFSIDSIQWENQELTRWVDSYKTYDYFWNLEKNQEKIKVWVIDTGIDYNHVDLKDNVESWYDFINNDSDALDDQWHWTHVAWVIGASVNQYGIFWVNPYVELIPLKICNKDGFCPSYAITKALSYSIENDIDIVNMSLWGKWDIKNSPICDGIKSYTDNWWIAVVASWNSNIDTSNFIPGWCEKSLTVWAFDNNLDRAVFSNYWDKVDISAPWVDIYSTYLNNWYKKLSWTSMASPHISWLVSILKNYDNNLDIYEIKDLFKEYNINVNSDSSKKMAWWVNTEALFNNFFNKENKDLEEKIEEENKNEKKEIIELEKDDTILVKDLKFIENQEILDNQKNDYKDPWYPELNNLEILNTIIEFWDNSLEISDLQDYETEEEIIDENKIWKLDYSISTWNKMFDSKWNIISEDAEIESFEEEKFSDFEDDNEIKQIYLSWSENYIKINSVWEYKKIKLKEYSEEEKFDGETSVIELDFKPDFYNFWKWFKKEEQNIWIQSEPERLVTYETKKAHIRGKYLNFKNYEEDIALYTNDKRYSHISPKNHYFTWLKAWTTLIDVYRKRRYQKSYMLEVLPKPVPVVYDVEIKAGRFTSIYFPEDISKYSFSKIGDNIDEDLDVLENEIIIDTFWAWELKMYLRDSAWFDRYIVNIHCVPQIDIYNINVTDTVETRYNDNYDFYEEDKTIVKQTLDKDDNWIIIWKKEWKTKVNIYKNRGLRRVFDITVNPIPEPIEINCDIVVWEKCRFRIRNWWHTYTESKEWIIETDEKTFSINVDWLWSWTAKIYLKSYYWNYNTHILNINISAKPPKIYTCEIPKWLECETYKYGESEDYTYSVSEEWKVRLISVRYWIDGVRQDYEKLHIEWIQEWETEVYIYKLWDHIATIQTIVLPELKPISFSDKIVTIKQTDNVELQVLTWWWTYYTKEYNNEIIMFDVDKETWLVEISWKNPWVDYPIITDKYNQEWSLKVIVEDEQLVLDAYELNLELWQEEYINVMEVYRWIKEVRKNNENVKAYDIKFIEWWEAIKVIAEQEWTTILEVEDCEGNIRTVRVVVWNGGEEWERDEVGFGSLFLLNNTEEENLKNIVAFNVEWEYNEVGIEYKNDEWLFVREPIEKNEEWFYVIQAEDSACTNCLENFQPYILDNIWNYIYPKWVWDYLAFEDSEFTNVAIVENDNMWIASNEEVVSVQELPNISYFWKNREDLSAKYILYLAIIWWTYKWYDISAYMLNEFMNWDGNDKQFDNNHWITEKVKETEWYKNKYQELSNNIEKYDNLENWKKEPVWKEVWIQILDNWSVLEADLFYSFWHITYQINVVKENESDIFMEVIINDIYDFAPSYDKWFTTNFLNAFASYYQEQNLWKIFNWKIIIYEKIN